MDFRSLTSGMEDFLVELRRPHIQPRLSDIDLEVKVWTRQLTFFANALDLDCSQWLSIMQRTDRRTGRGTRADQEEQIETPI